MIHQDESKLKECRGEKKFGTKTKMASHSHNNNITNLLLTGRKLRMVHVKLRRVWICVVVIPFAEMVCQVETPGVHTDKGTQK